MKNEQVNWDQVGPELLEAAKMLKSLADEIGREGFTKEQNKSFAVIEQLIAEIEGQEKT